MVWQQRMVWEKPDELEGEAHGLGVAQLVQVGGAGKVDHGRRTAQNNLDSIFFQTSHPRFARVNGLYKDYFVRPSDIIVGSLSAYRSSERSENDAYTGKNK